MPPESPHPHRDLRSPQAAGAGGAGPGPWSSSDPAGLEAGPPPPRGATNGPRPAWKLPRRADDQGNELSRAGGGGPGSGAGGSPGPRRAGRPGPETPSPRRRLRRAGLGGGSRGLQALPAPPSPPCSSPGSSTAAGSGADRRRPDPAPRPPPRSSAGSRAGPDHTARRLAPSLGPVLYDVGTLGLQPGPRLKPLNSGLLLASRYPLLRASFHCFPDAKREDALASKGLLSVQVPPARRGLPRSGGATAGQPVGGLRPRLGLQVLLGLLEGQRVVGLLHCPRSCGAGAAGHPLAHTHVSGAVRSHPHAPPPWRTGPCAARSSRGGWTGRRLRGGEVVASSVLLGDLHFDNCSQGELRPGRRGARSPGPSTKHLGFLPRSRAGAGTPAGWARAGSSPGPGVAPLGRGPAGPAGPTGTILRTSRLHRSVACSPRCSAGEWGPGSRPVCRRHEGARALASPPLSQGPGAGPGRHLHLAGSPQGSRRAKPWRGRRLGHTMYREVPGGPLSRRGGAGPAGRPQVEQVTFRTALAGLTDRLALSLQPRVSGAPAPAPAADLAPEPRSPAG
ncbi:LOW QUALITY PROTEIN: uncharacterized protein RHO17_013084 [Thomomys bottae]